MTFLTSLAITLISVYVVLQSGKVEARPVRSAVRSIAYLIGGIAFLITLSKMLVNIPAGKVGVIDFEGQVANGTLAPGLHLANPFSDVVKFSTRLQDIKETINATSQEGLSFSTDVSVQYRLDPQKAVQIYQTIGTDEREIIISRFRAIVREVTASYPAEAIYGKRRVEVSNRMQQRLREQIEPLGFVVDQVLLREVKVPDALQASIQEKLKAEQDSQRMTFVLEQERQESDRKRIEAQGTADAQKILSQGLTPAVLQLRSIEATEKLAESQNAKIVVMGGKGSNTPLVLSGGD